MIGQKSGYLELLEIDKEKTALYNRTYYKCRCSLCDEITSVRNDKLNGITTVACRKCSMKLNRKQAITIGAIFGDFKVIECSGVLTKSHAKYWKCQCLKCGTEKDINADHLKSQQNTCTQCNYSSHGERTIREILERYSINFIEQYRFDNLKKFPFDFAVFDKQNQVKFVIEFDGSQHYTPVEAWGGENNFKRQLERDAEKTKYCKENNIPLIRIPYTQLASLNMLYILKEANTVILKNKIPLGF